MSFVSGAEVAVRTTDGRWLSKTIVAAGGYDFPCWNVKWAGATDEDWVPWPVEDVKPLAEHPDAIDQQTYLAAVSGRSRRSTAA